MSTRQDEFDALFGPPQGAGAPTDEFDRLFPAKKAEGPSMVAGMAGLVDALINPPPGGVMMNPIAQGFSQVMTPAIPTVMKALGAWNPLAAPSTGLAAYRMVGLAGALKEGVLDPIAALAGIPTLPLGYRTNLAADFIHRAGQGLYDATEVQAKKMGMTDEEIKITYDVGGFIGMTLPMTASIKAAQFMFEGKAAFQSATKVASYATSGHVMHDVAAGAIYGGLFEEGNVGERLKRMSSESALWGAFGLVVRGQVPTLLSWRQRRAMELSRENEILKVLQDLENGVRPTISAENMPGVLQLQQDEHFILMSPAAQDILAQDAGDLALMQAYRDLTKRQLTGGVFRSAGRTLEEVQARVERFKAKFPDLKFSFPIKRSLGTRLSSALEGAEGPAEQLEQFTYDIYFGTKGLTNKQLAQLKTEGHFAGQIFQDGANYVEYVGKGQGAKLTTHVRVKYKTADGKTRIKHIEKGRLTETPLVAEEWERVPQWDAVYKNFQEWFFQKQRAVAAARGSINEADLVMAAREGKLHIDEDQRRLFDQAGAIIHPEEAGLFGEESVKAVLLRPNPEWTPTPGQVAPWGSPQGQTTWGTIVRNPHPGQSSGGFNQARAEIDEAFWSGRITQEERDAALQAALPKDPWRLAVFDYDTPIGHVSYPTLQDAVNAAEMGGFRLDKVTKAYPTGDETLSMIAQGNLSAAHLLDPPPVMTFRDAVQVWMKERGLPLDAPDAPALEQYFQDRIRRWAWETAPEEERAVFEAIRAEQEKLLGEGELPLEMLANNKGFWIQRLDNGRIVGRHMETGLPVAFGSERTAREGLAKIIRPEADLPSILPLGPEGLHAFTGGLPVQDLLHFPESIRSLESLREMDWQSRKRAVRNLRDVFIAIERQTGLPIFTEGLDKLLQGREAFMSEYDPLAKIIEKTWSGIKKDRRYKIVDFWQDAEANKLTFRDAVQQMIETGEFSAKEVQAFRRSRAILDYMFPMTGISPERYIETYFSRLRPFFEANGAMDVKEALSKFGDVKPSEFVFWAEMSRTGNISTFEKDPAMVLHKYTRGVLWQKHMKEPWDKMAVLTGVRGKGAEAQPIRIRDLAPDQQKLILANPAPGTTADSPVLPTALRDVIQEFLVHIRGTPSASEQTTRDFMQAIFHRLKIDADPAVMEEYMTMLMSTWYGSALAMRPATVARNMTQVLWNLWTRQGGKHISRGMEWALKEANFEEMVAEGVFHMSEAGIPYGDLITDNMIERGIHSDGGPLSHALASAMQKGLRTGNISKRAARKMLVHYSSSDQASRGWVYGSTKLHADEWLTKWEAGKINYEEFEEEGLAFFDPVVKKKFRQIYDVEGRERSLRYIARMGSDEANFLYVSGVQPAWLQKVWARPFGMFGTYPMWQLELYFNRVRNGTPGQQAKFWLRNLALVGAFANISIQTGTDMWNWLAPGSAFGWAGGPAVEHAVNLYQAVTAPLGQRSAAFGRMVKSGLRLSFPGQGFINDLERASTADDPNSAFLWMMLGRDVDDTNWAMNYLYDPTADPMESFLSDETRATLQHPSTEWVQPPAQLSTLFQFGEEKPKPRGTGGRLRMSVPGAVGLEGNTE